MLDKLNHISQLINQASGELKRLNQSVEKDDLRLLNLYSGLSEGDGANQFLSRLKQDTTEKKHLADYLFRSMDPEHQKALVQGVLWQAPKCLFCESGTTFAQLIGDYAKKENRQFIPQACHTNNLLAEIAWINHIKDVYVSPGRFLPKYYGLLPFADKKEAADKEYEHEGYAWVTRAISGCDVVFATCSHFSLIAGPLVGSRANALFKNAMFAGLRTQKFILMFAFSKVIPFSTQPTGLHLNPPDENCICELPRGDMRLPDLDKSLWHGKWLVNQVKHAKDLALNWLKARPWLEIAPDVVVLIGLPDSYEQPYEFLKREIDIVNKYFHSSQDCKLNATLSDHWFASKYKIAEIQFRRR